MEGTTALIYEVIISVAEGIGPSKLLPEFGGLDKTNIFINSADSFC